jgi:hypothetical protein
LNIHEVKGEEEIHIYMDPVDLDPNGAPLQIKMCKYCYTEKPNARIKYFLDKDGNKVILIIGEEGLDLAKYSGEGATTTVGIGRDDKSYGIDFNVGACSCSEGVDASVGSSNYNMESEEGGTECKKNYEDDNSSEDDEDYISSSNSEEGFEFSNANKDEWIDSLQGDSCFGQISNGVTDREN